MRDCLTCPTFSHACFQTTSSHALHLSLISLPYCNHLVQFSTVDKCPHFLVAHLHLRLNCSPTPHRIKTMVSTRSSTRIKQSASPERPFSPASPESHIARNDDLPPPISKEERGTRSHVQKPLEQIRLTAFVHILLCILLVCLAWYAYRTTIVALDTFTSTNVFFPTSFPLHSNPLWQFFLRHYRWGGGLGRDGHSGGTQLDVERRIEELADTLGVDPVEFARAIAGEVRKLVPPASLSLLANGARETGGGRIMDVLMDRYAHG